MKKEILFDDTSDLWVWLFSNNNNFSNKKMSDEKFSKEIDSQFDKVCKEIKEKGFAIKNETILKIKMINGKFII